MTPAVASGGTLPRPAQPRLGSDRWDVPARYPWNEWATVVGLVVLVTEHETADHCDLLKAATTSA